MASVDNYTVVGWKDAPEHQTTPTSATNFNHMDNGIKENNTAIQDLCTEVADKAPKNPTFTQASTRTNINSGESTETIFGKIKKWFASLGSLAFISTNSSTSNYLRGDGTWVTPPNTTYSNATASAAGLMSAADKTKLNGIASGAQVNSVTGVKGSAEGSYRTGNINLTAANLGIGNATTSAAGLMSKTDKAKLDGVESGAQVNSIKGVKGASESSYRTGYVSISASNIGLGNVDNTRDANKSVNYANTAGRATTAGDADYATAAGTGWDWGNNPGYTGSGNDPKYSNYNLVTGPTNNTMNIDWKHIGGYGPFMKVGGTNVGNLVRGNTDHNITVSWNGSRLELYIDGSYAGRVVLD